ncbi:hypothetical protein L7F22_004177 [Adiantum nelumboides]|nr:hypothetical protein [Adiantum nelumboides]
MGKHPLRLGASCLQNSLRVSPICPPPALSASGHAKSGKKSRHLKQEQSSNDSHNEARTPTMHTLFFVECDDYFDCSANLIVQGQRTRAKGYKRATGCHTHAEAMIMLSERSQGQLLRHFAYGVHLKEPPTLVAEAQGADGERRWPDFGEPQGLSYMQKEALQGLLLEWKGIKKARGCYM